MVTQSSRVVRDYRSGCDYGISSWRFLLDRSCPCGIARRHQTAVYVRTNDSRICRGRLPDRRPLQHLSRNECCRCHSTTDKPRSPLATVCILDCQESRQDRCWTSLQSRTPTITESGVFVDLCFTDRSSQKTSTCGVVRRHCGKSQVQHPPFNLRTVVTARDGFDISDR